MSDRQNNSLIAKGLHKKYGSRMVVNNVDIKVNRNEVVGLLGPKKGGKRQLFI
jgi:ABC-type (unclassified) transport system, ATPase component